MPDEQLKKNAGEIRTALRMGECGIVYSKLDGTTKYTMGTLHRYLIPKENAPKNPQLELEDGDAIKHPDLIHYFDTIERGWRAFWAENLRSLVVY